MGKKLTNRGYELLFRAAAIVTYAIPLIVVAIINRGRLLNSPRTTLTFFSLMLIIFFVVFAKKTIKRICKSVTPLLFGSIIAIILSLGIRSFANDIVVVAFASAIGAVCAWYPYQLSEVYARNAYDDKGNPIKEQGLTVGEATKILFSLFA